jgi:hypothetical protein
MGLDEQRRLIRECRLVRASVRRHRRAQGGSPMLRSIRPTRASGTTQLTCRGGSGSLKFETVTCPRGQVQRLVRRLGHCPLASAGGTGTRRHR